MSESAALNKIEIRYCPRCRWMMRAAWVSQELLTTFSEELDSVAIGPGDAGQFDIWLNGSLIWCRKEMGGFPELKPLKQRVRDHINPERGLGHSDRP